MKLGANRDLNQLFAGSELLGAGEELRADPAGGAGHPGDFFARLLDHYFLEMERVPPRAKRESAIPAGVPQVDPPGRVAAATEQFRAAPLVVVFDFGYSEVCRQMAARGITQHKRRWSALYNSA